MRHLQRLFVLCLGLLTAPAASAQGLVDPAVLRVQSTAACGALVRQLDGFESGSQWLIGRDIPLYAASNARRPLVTMPDSFSNVSCYGQIAVGGEDRVFVATEDGQVCGWVARANLLATHRGAALNAFQRREQSICETPRAMPFDTFCEKLRGVTEVADAACEGVPRGLRAKGVLTGSTSAAVAPEYPFFTAPENGRVRESRLFFSVLEIHDVARGGDGKPMVLTGDGEGTLFGWIDLNALALWPTRLGLFYDPDGAGQMFQRLRNLIRNWRDGTPPADITAGLSPEALRAYIHGSLQLLSYPIIRTVDPSRDPLASDAGDTPYHEVIFLGQTGDGSASQLMAESQFAREVDALQRLNVLMVVDTTESMRPYLPLIQTGIADFIRDYGRQSLDIANRLPDVRLGLVAYSDFLAADQTTLDDPIRTEEVLPPTRIGPGFDVSAALARISAHPGLDDAVGLREESALEAVAQLSATFVTNPGWFEDGPRVILHIADHGSRPDVDPATILARLAVTDTYYVPIAVLTDDAGDAGRQAARQRFMDQALRMSAPLVDGPPVPSDVAQIDLNALGTQTPDVVRAQLNLVMQEVMQAVQNVRRDIVGDELASTSRTVEDLAASRVILDERLLSDRGLDAAEDAIVQADTGFAPLLRRDGPTQLPIDWTYTVSLEPAQASFLRQNFEGMCALVGSPEQSGAFRQLIVRLAEAFSGDRVESNRDVRAVLSDLRAIPGADQSFLAQSPDILLARADSTDPQVIEALRRDICWISYHLGNMDARIYARPDQIQWTGRDFVLRPGEQVIRRIYRYKPVVGAETVYVPSFFFVLPSIVEARAEDDDCAFFCD